MMTHRIPLAAVMIAAMVACGRSESTISWAEFPDSVGFRSITGATTACTNCITFTQIATLGTDTIEGFLEDRGTIDNVVRDQEGRYWVGQRTMIKVFAPDGRYLRAVGRQGQGPMEFAFAQPVQVDTTGAVHVFDATLGRETIIGPDFNHRADRTIPVAFDGMAPLSGDGHHYVIAKPMAVSGRMALPLHVISGAEILTSFGLVPNTSEVFRGESNRIVAVSPSGYVFSAKRDTYVVEAWTETGSRVAGFELPNFNADAVRPGGLWAADNPPQNYIEAIAPHDAQRLWVVSRHRRPNWLEFTVERVAPGVGTYLEPKDSKMSNVFRSRIDLVDLNTSTIVASSWYEGLLKRFFEPDLILKLDYDENGAPQLQILRVSLKLR